MSGVADYQARLVTDPARVADIARRARRVAVLGIKTEAQADQAAFYVAKHLADAGVQVIPVPVYYPDVQQILGQPVYRRVADVPGPIDIVDVFRRPTDIDAHVDDLIAARPAVVWFQKGIRNDAAAERLARAGIEVVQDHCLMVEHRRATGAAGG